MIECWTMENITENKRKARVLQFFLSRPERSFFAGELRKKLGSRGLENDLTALVKQGLLFSTRKRGNKYYRINSKHPQYLDLKNWAKRIKRVAEDDLVKIVRRLPGVKLAVLSGFLAGENKLECDLLLVGKFPAKKLDNFVKSAESLVDNEINYAVMDLAEFDYRKNTFDRFMKDIFENTHVVLVDKISAAAK